MIPLLFAGDLPAEVAKLLILTGLITGIFRFVFKTIRFGFRIIGAIVLSVIILRIAESFL